MNYPDEMKVFDLSEGYDSEYIRSFDWGIGKYNEKRKGMYKAPQFDGKRNIHMAVDIWSSAGKPVYAFEEGMVAYFKNNDRPGDYGPTIVTKHTLKDNTIYALHGHLSENSLENIEVGQPIKKGEQIATIGTEKVNGGWAPHLHFQLSVKDPGQADMPGVVSEEDHQQALNDFPDPRIVLGELY